MNDPRAAFSDAWIARIVDSANADARDSTATGGEYLRDLSNRLTPNRRRRGISLSVALRRSGFLCGASGRGRRRYFTHCGIGAPGMGTVEFEGAGFTPAALLGKRS